jgi:hypothetical protein
VPTLTLSPLASAVAGLFRAASHVRGERAIHARGRAFSGRLSVSGGGGTGAHLLDAPGTYDVVVRLSRSVGLPQPSPDILGFALRVVDAYGAGAHQDLMLDSASRAPVLRRLPAPSRDLLGSTYNSLLPYAAGGRHWLVGARALPGSPRVTRLDALPQELSFGLLVASPHGRWEQVGVVRTTGVLPAPEGRRLRFHPGNTGGGLELAGPMQEWRRRSYDATHVGADA